MLQPLLSKHDVLGGVSESINDKHYYASNAYWKWVAVCGLFLGITWVLPGYYLGISWVGNVPDGTLVAVVMLRD